MADIGAHGENVSVNVDETVNVQFLDVREASCSQTKVDEDVYWEKLATSDKSQNYEIVERWMLIKEGKWSSLDNVDTELFKTDILSSLLEWSDQNPNNTKFVGLQPFSYYAYWRGDVEFKIVVNANKFQIGQLQASFYYGYDYDKFKELRDNIYCRSQMQHVLINASCSNIGCLYIPYKHFKPLMPLFKRRDQMSSVNLGRFSLRVMVGLNVPATIHNVCNYAVFVRFPNSKFSGMLYMDWDRLKPTIEYQMFRGIASAVASEGMKWLATSLKPDKNRDKPTSIAPPASIVPWSGHSWSAGTNVYEITNMLRLDLTGQTPYTGIIDEEEMTVSYVSRIYGFVKTIKWNSNKSYGTELVDFGVGPLFNTGSYVTSLIEEDGKLASYYIPPVGVIASLFAYWRGTIEFRFDFVCSQFHTGRLLACVVPRYMENITIDEARSCPYVIFDLQEKYQFVFEVPFISDKPWWPRRYHCADNNNEQSHPSILRLFVLNPLIPMDSVSNEVYINVYVRGGKDFEVSVPSAPSLGLSVDRSYLTPTKGYVVYVKSGYMPFYIGTWRFFYDSGKYGAIGRYSTKTDRICQLEEAKVGEIYKQAGAVTTPKLADGTSCPYMVAYHNDGYWYPIFFKNYKEAKVYAGSYKVKDSTIITKGGDWFSDTSIYWVVAPPEESDSDNEISDGSFEFQMDERKEGSMVSELCESLSSTNFGFSTYSENFDSLKTLCRRYQLYGTCTINPHNTMNPQGAVKVPVMPGGLMLDIGRVVSIKEVFNRGREGYIPIIANGYRFFRGSLRFRIVFDSAAINQFVFIQHRPDISCDTECKISQITNFKDAHDLLLSGYAFLYQGLLVNQVVEIEVPYYLPGQYGLLQYPDFKGNQDIDCYSSLGTLLIGSTSSTILNCEIYYSLADDTRFSVFQGFIAMVFNYRVPTIVEYQGPIETTTVVMGSGLFMYGGYRFLKAFENVSQAVEGTSSTLIDVAEDVRSNATTSFNNITTTLSDIKIDVKDRGNNIVQKVKEASSNFIDNTMSSDVKNLIFNAISNMMHIFANPTPVTAGIAIGSFLVQLGYVSINYVKTLYTSLTKLFTNLAGNEHQAPGYNYDVVISYISALVCGAGLLFEKMFTLSKKSTLNLAKGLLHGIKEFAMTANCLTQFLKNNVKIIMIIIDWFMRKINPGYNLATAILVDDKVITDWANEVVTLTSSDMEESCKSNFSVSCRVYDAASKATEILAGVASIKSPEINIPIVMKLGSDIIKLRDKLLNYKICPPVRFEPYVLYMYGDPGVGKSFLSQSIDIALLKSINYTTTGEPRFVVTPNNAYWNGLKNQPICQFDDFCAFGSEAGSIEASYLFQLKSTAIFNPAQAEIENKHIRYNPILVTICSNQAFPKPVAILDMVAFWRRRDKLVKIVNKYSSIEEARNKCDISKFEHLLFEVHYDVVNESCQPQMKYNYNDFLIMLKADFERYVILEGKNFRHRLNESKALLPSEDIEVDESFFNRFEMDGVNEEDRARLQTAEENVIRSGRAAIDSLIQGQMRMHHARNLLIHQRYNITGTYDGIDDSSIISTKQDRLLELKSQYEEQAYIMCEHRRFVPAQWSYDFEQGYFINGNDVCQLTYCNRECLWAICNEIKDIHIELWVRHNESVLQYAIEAGTVHADVVAIYDRIKNREPERVFRLTDKSYWYNIMKSIVEKVFGSINYLWECLKSSLKILKYIAPFVLAMSVVKIGSKCLMSVADKTISAGLEKYFSDAGEYELNEFQIAHTSGDIAQRGARIPRIAREWFMRPYNIEFQSEDMIEHFKKCIKRNTIFIICEKFRMRCLGIFGHYAIMPYHYLEYIKMNDGIVKYIMLIDGTQIFIQDLKYIKTNDSHLVLVEMPPQVPLFKDIVKFFLRKNEIGQLSTEGLLIKNDVGNMDIVQLRYGTKKNVVVPGSSGMSGSTLPVCFNYNYGGRGVCGSVLLDNKHHHGIIGMHYAGESFGKEGYSEILIYERFKKIYDVTDVRDVETELEYQCEDISSESMFSELNLRVYGNVPKQFAHNETGYAKFEKSLAYDKIFPCTTEPCILSPKDDRNTTGYSPMQEGIRKQERAPWGFTTGEKDFAKEYLNNLILAHCKPQRQDVGILTEEQAICGIPGLKQYDSLEMSSSEAFPYTSYRPQGQSDKRWLLDLDVTEQGYKLKKIHPMLRAILDRKQKLRESGIVPETIFVNSLKQQCMSKENACKPGKARIFNMSSLDKTIVDVQYTKDFSVAFQESMFKLYHAIGIDVNSQQFLQAYVHLKEVGDLAMDGDYQAFGPTLYTEFVLYCFEVISNWYDVYGSKLLDKIKDRRIRKILAYELAQAKYLAFRTLYAAFCGAPSGSALTVIINTMVNLLYIFCAFYTFWSTKVQQPLPGTIMEIFFGGVRYSDVVKAMESWLRLLVYGDDIIMVVNKMIKDFNMLFLVDYFAYRGIKFHSADKTDILTKFKPLECCTFLKCQFVWNEEKRVMLAKLPYDSYSNAFNWVWKHPNMLQATLEAIESAMPLMIGLGRDSYTYTKEEIETFFREFDIAPHLNCWDDEIAARYFPRMDRM